MLRITHLQHLCIRKMACFDRQLWKETSTEGVSELLQDKALKLGALGRKPAIQRNFRDKRIPANAYDYFKANKKDKSKEAVS